MAQYSARTERRRALWGLQPSDVDSYLDPNPVGSEPFFSDQNHWLQKSDTAPDKNRTDPQHWTQHVHIGLLCRNFEKGMPITMYRPCSTDCCKDELLYHLNRHELNTRAKSSYYPIFSTPCT
jgi:hypothetical protein